MSEVQMEGNDFLGGALKIKEQLLADELAAVIEARDTEIQAARDKYAAALKEIKAKQGRLKRMIKTSEAL
jgi:hypothetical protein